MKKHAFLLFTLFCLTLMTAGCASFRQVYQTPLDKDSAPGPTIEPDPYACLLNPGGPVVYEGKAPPQKIKIPSMEEEDFGGIQRDQIPKKKLKEIEKKAAMAMWE